MQGTHGIDEGDGPNGGTNMLCLSSELTELSRRAKLHGGILSSRSDSRHNQRYAVKMRTANGDGGKLNWVNIDFPSGRRPAPRLNG